MTLISFLYIFLLFSLSIVLFFVVFSLYSPKLSFSSTAQNSSLTRSSSSLKW